MTKTPITPTDPSVTTLIPSVGINSVVLLIAATGGAVGMATRNAWWGIASISALWAVLLGALKLAGIIGVIRKHNEMRMLERLEQKLDALARPDR